MTPLGPSSILNRVRLVAPRAPWAAALFVYVLATTAMLWPSIRPGQTLMPADILGGVPPYQQVIEDPSAHNGLPSDAPLQFYPYVKFVADELHEGRLPQWNPLILGGVPMSPNGFVPTNYPPTLLLGVLDAFDGYNLLVVLHLVIAAIGGYAVSRRLAAPFWVALAAGFGTLLGGIWFHWSLHLVHLVGMVWLPLVLAATHRAVRQPSALATVGLALPFGAWWLGGNPQFCYFGTLLVGAVATALLLHQLASRSHVVASASSFAVGLLAGAAIAAPTLLPTAVIADDIARAREPPGSMAHTHLTISEVVELVVPEIGGSPIGGILYLPDRYGGYQMDTPYVGVSILIFAIAALGSGRGRTRTLLGLAIGVALVLGFSSWPHRIMYDHLPGYDRFRASSRWLAVIPAMASPLAAYGVATVLRGSRGARLLGLLGAAAAATVVAVLAREVARDPLAPQRFLAGRFVLAAVPTVMCAAALVLSRQRPKLTTILFGAAVVLEVFTQVPRWYPSVREATAYPELAVTRIARANGGRIIRVGPQTTGPSLVPNLPMAYGLADAQGLAVLFPKAADRYLRTIEDYGNFAIAVNLSPPLSTFELTSSPLLDALDVRTVIVDTTPPLSTSYVLKHDGPPAVYERPSPGSAVLVRSAISASEEEMWAAIADPAWNPAETATVTDLPKDIIGEGGSAESLRLLPDDQEWQVRSSEGGLLRVSGAYHSGWEATVDGQPAAVYRADGLFRAIVVPAGNHVVRFRFRNEAEVTGRWVALSAVSGLGAAIAIDWRRRRSRTLKSDGRLACEDEELLAKHAPNCRRP